MKRVLMFILLLAQVSVYADPTNFRIGGSYERQSNGRYHAYFVLTLPDNYVGDNYDVIVYFNYDILYSDGTHRKGYDAGIYGVSPRYDHTGSTTIAQPVDMKITIDRYRYKMQDYPGSEFNPTMPENTKPSKSRKSGPLPADARPNPIEIDYSYTGINDMPEAMSAEDLSGKWYVYADGKCSDLYGWVDVDMVNNNEVSFPWNLVKTEGKSNNKLPEVGTNLESYVRVKNPSIANDIFVFYTCYSYIEKSESSKRHIINYYAYILQKCGDVLKGRRVSIRDAYFFYYDGDLTEHTEDCGRSQAVVLQRNLN